MATSGGGIIFKLEAKNVVLCKQVRFDPISPPHTACLAAKHALSPLCSVLCTPDLQRNRAQPKTGAQGASFVRVAAWVGGFGGPAWGRPVLTSGPISLTPVVWVWVSVMCLAGFPSMSAATGVRP